MPNPIKYSTGAETRALKKGNFYIGTGDVDKGPTANTGYYNGISPTGGYTIYLNRVSGGPSMICPGNDTELIYWTNQIAGASYTTVAQCLTYFAGQTDKICVNRDYPAIVTDGLVINLDSGFAPSYPTSGTTWYDMGPNSLNATLTNGPSFQSQYESIYFDGTDDQASIVGTPSALDITSQITMIAWVNPTTVGGSWQGIFLRQTVGDYELWMYGDKLRYGLRLNGTMYRDSGSISLTANTWYMLAWTYDGSTVRLYVNAVADSTFSRSGAISTSDSTIYIGYSGYASERFNGYIASCQLYSKALSASEILRNYNAQRSLGSVFNPATSAAAILSANPTAPDGYYWIKTNLGDRKLYCLMSLGGWMGMTSELCPQTANVSTSASWETNTSGRLQRSNTSILNVSLVEGGCGDVKYYQLQNPSTRGLNYTQSMLLMQRVSTIGQCSEITGGTGRGYYTGPEYTGSYTSNGMCLWSDGIFANGSAQDMTNLKRYWVMLGSGTNPSLYYQVQCAGGSGQHYHMWFIK